MDLFRNNYSSNSDADDEEEDEDEPMEEIKFEHVQEILCNSDEKRRCHPSPTSSARSGSDNQRLTPRGADGSQRSSRRMQRSNKHKRRSPRPPLFKTTMRTGPSSLT